MPAGGSANRLCGNAQPAPCPGDVVINSAGDVPDPSGSGCSRLRRRRAHRPHPGDQPERQSVEPRRDASRVSAACRSRRPTSARCVGQAAKAGPFSIPTIITDIAPTVADLVSISNQALSGTPLSTFDPALTYANLNVALSALTQAFDGCRSICSCNSVPPGSSRHRGHAAVSKVRSNEKARATIGSSGLLASVSAQRAPTTRARARTPPLAGGALPQRRVHGCCGRRACPRPPAARRALREQRAALGADAGARACARRSGWKAGSLPLANATISFEMRMLHQSWPHMAQKSVSTSRSSSCSARAVSPSKASSNCCGQLSAARARDRSSSHCRAPRDAARDVAGVRGDLVGDAAGLHVLGACGRPTCSFGVT